MQVEDIDPDYADELLADQEAADAQHGSGHPNRTRRGDQDAKKAGFMALIRGAPRDLWVVVTGVFLESLAYFSLSLSFVLMLEEEYGFDDVKATSTYAAFGIAISAHGVLFGWLVDWLLVRKSLLLYAGVGFASKLALGLAPSEGMLWIVVLGPLAFSLSLGGTAVLAGIRRYTTDSTRNVAFSLRYVSMNVGALISEPLMDAVRIYIVPGLRAQGYNGYSLFIAITAVLHFLNFALTYFMVRDAYVTEEPWRIIQGVRAVSATPLTTSAHTGDYIAVKRRRWEMSEIRRPRTGCPCSNGVGMRLWVHVQWRNFTERLDRRLGGFILLSFGVMGAQSIFRYLDSLYPLWMTRAPYPVDHPADVPYNSFLIVNPALVLLFTTVFANLADRRAWHPYWTIFFGTVISATSAFWMMIVQYWAVFVFLIQMSLGEIIWSPMLSTYSTWFAPEGSEGIFFALATIPLFGAKALAGVLSGYVLQTYCPNPNATIAGDNNTAAVAFDAVQDSTCQPVVWLIVAALACSSPVIILAAYKCVKIPRPQRQAQPAIDIDVLPGVSDAVDLDDEDAARRQEMGI